MGYVVGWNAPGFLPECDPVEFEDWTDAVEYLVATIDEAWDEEYAVVDWHPDLMGIVDEGFMDAHAELHNLGEGREFSAQAGEYVYWLQAGEVE